MTIETPGLWVIGTVKNAILTPNADPKKLRLNLTLDVGNTDKDGNPKPLKVVAHGYAAKMYEDVQVGEDVAFKIYCKVDNWTPPGGELVHYVQYNIKVDYKPKATGGSINNEQLDLDDTMDDNFL